MNLFQTIKKFQNKNSKQYVLISLQVKHRFIRDDDSFSRDKKVTSSLIFRKESDQRPCSMMRTGTHSWSVTMASKTVYRERDRSPSKDCICVTIYESMYELSLEDNKDVKTEILQERGDHVTGHLRSMEPDGS